MTSTLGDYLRRLRLLLGRDRALAELEDEMRVHLEYRADAFRERGVDGQDAALAAQKRFGNRTVIQEESRDAWGMHLPEQLAADLRHAVRRLAQRPGFALAVIGVLALGIGATTAMFSAVDAAMLRPLPFPRPGELVTLPHVQVPFDPGTDRFPPPPVHILDVRDAAGFRDIFAHVAAYAVGGLNLTDPDHPSRVQVGVVTDDFFATMGVPPLLGRGFSHAEGIPNGPLATVLSFGLWQRQFGGRAIEGLTAQLNGKSYAVVGVMPEGFAFPADCDLWVPMTVPTTFATFEAFRGFLPSTTIARVARGLTRPQADARMLARWQQSLAGATSETDLREYVDEMRRTGAALPLQQTLVGDRRTALLVLLGATAVLLLIACANVTNLLLSHAATRRREIAVRQVLGATPGRIVRQLLAESVTLSVAAAALGILLAPLALRTMRVLMPAQLAGVATAHVDVRVLTFATALALVTGVGFGLWPALGSGREDPGATIKTGGEHGATPLAAGRVLVGSEIALTLMLLVGAGLMLRSFEHLMGLDKGMNPAHVATLEMSISDRAQPWSERLQKLDAIMERLRALPGIDAAGMVNDLPLRGGGGIALRVAEPKPVGKTDFGGARQLAADAGYFAALGISLLAGRLFTDVDDSLAPPVAVISHSMAKLFWGDADPIGRQFKLSTASDATGITVIGVVADVREGSLDRDPGAQMYTPIATWAPQNVALVARGTVPSRVLLSRLTEAVRTVDPGQAVFNVRMMDDVIGASVASRRANTLMITAFAVLALLLASLGVYAVVMYGVAQRGREFGIRAALGATRSGLMAMVAREMASVAVVGVAVGLGGAWALSRVLSSLVYGVDLHDAAIFVTVPLAILVPVAIATVVPARRATAVSPSEVLRSD